MKSVYVKNLELFEQEDFFGKEVAVNKFDSVEANTRSREGNTSNIKDIILNDFLVLDG